MNTNSVTTELPQIWTHFTFWTHTTAPARENICVLWCARAVVSERSCGFLKVTQPIGAQLYSKSLETLGVVV